MRLAYLSGYEKDYNESIYQALAKGYEQYSSEDTLEAICKYVMKGNPRKTEYFRWFSLAVENGLRLTRLYEYYVETMDTSRRMEIPSGHLFIPALLQIRKKSRQHTSAICQVCGISPGKNWLRAK